ADDKIFVGAIRTTYLRNAGRRISFGELGHAALVDRDGKVISHPLADWEKSRHGLADLTIVQNMMKGETGVGQFYSPALSTDMVAGYTTVPGPDWGVMVPQPIRELQAKADNVKSAVLTVLVFGLTLAALVAYLASKLLTHPFEQMVRAMNLIGAGELRAYESISDSRWRPIEFAAARDGIKAMSERLQENIDTISRHAYLDGITGLPNRECFRVLAQEEIDKMRASRAKCAILFLDLDGFKQVNDVYGHRSGDDLLKGFASKLHTYCGQIMKRNARGADNAMRILPARLGGDEFVVMLSNMNDLDFPAEFSKGLFQRVFGPMTIHNGVSLNVSGSVGGAIFPDQAGDFDELLRQADIAMYDAKNNGKGRFSLYSPSQELKTSASSEQLQRA
nr:diguanylate cyclase [Rhizobiaceae bacterium]